MTNSIGKILSEIEGELQDEQIALNELEKQAAEVRERVNRLSKAYRALSDQEKAKPRVRRNGGSNKDAAPHPDSIQAFLVVLSEAGEPLTAKDIVERTGRSISHVQHVARYLRAHEMIRLAGSRGMSHLYAPMTTKPVLKEADSAA